MRSLEVVLPAAEEHNIFMDFTVVLMAIHVTDVAIPIGRSPAIREKMERVPVCILVVGRLTSIRSHVTIVAISATMVTRTSVIGYHVVG